MDMYRTKTEGKGISRIAFGQSEFRMEQDDEAAMSQYSRTDSGCDLAEHFTILNPIISETETKNITN